MVRVSNPRLSETTVNFTSSDDKQHTHNTQNTHDNTTTQGKKGSRKGEDLRNGSLVGGLGEQDQLFVEEVVVFQPRL